MSRVDELKQRLALIKPNYKAPGEWNVSDIKEFEKHLKGYENVKGDKRIPPERVSFDIVDDAGFSQRSPRKKSQFHERMVELNKKRMSIPKDQKILNRKRDTFPEHRDLTDNFKKKTEVGSNELGFTNKEAEELTTGNPNYHGGKISKLKQRLSRLQQ